jgi:hypothetical protein
MVGIARENIHLFGIINLYVSIQHFRNQNLAWTSLHQVERLMFQQNFHHFWSQMLQVHQLSGWEWLTGLDDD